MKQEKKDEIFRKLSEEFDDKKVILKSGHIGRIISVTRADGFGDAVAFDIKIEDTVYDVPICSVICISRDKEK